MTTELNPITEHAKYLAVLRKMLTDRHEISLEIGAELEATKLFERWQKALSAETEIKGKIAEVEGILREAVLSVYEQTGEKQYPGAAVKIFTVRKYSNLAALSFCVRHQIDAALKLDKRQFEKIADVMKPDFVEFDEEPKVYIDGDLSKFLEE